MEKHAGWKNRLIWVRFGCSPLCSIVMAPNRYRSKGNTRRISGCTPAPWRVSVSPRSESSSSQQGLGDAFPGSIAADAAQSLGGSKLDQLFGPAIDHLLEQSGSSGVPTAGGEWFNTGGRPSRHSRVLSNWRTSWRQRLRCRGSICRARQEKLFVSTTCPDPVDCRTVAAQARPGPRTRHGLELCSWSRLSQVNEFPACGPVLSVGKPVDRDPRQRSS